MTFPPQLSLHSALWLDNLTVAVVLIAVTALIAERVFRNSSLPIRHGILLSALGLTALSPVLISVAFRFGWGLDLPLSWNEMLVSQTEAAPVEPEPTTPIMEPRTLVPLDEYPEVVTMPPEPLTVGDILLPGEVLTFRTPQPPVAALESVTNSFVVDEPVQTVNETADATPMVRFVDWRPTIIASTSWWLLIWSIGVVASGLRLLLGWRQVWRLKASMQEVSDERLLAMLERTAQCIGLARAPRLMFSPRVPVPAVCGLWRPIIVLPERFTAEVPAESVGSILLHECAHIRRCDLWIGCLQRLVGVLFWWNLALRSVQRRLSDLREDLCDNHVLAHHPDGRGYARILLDLVSRASSSRPVPVSVGLVEGPSSGLSARITRLLKEDRNMATRLNRGSAAGLFALTALTAVAVCSLSMRAEQAAADDSTADAPRAENPDTQEPAIENPSQEATEVGPSADQPPAFPHMAEQSETLSPLFYDDQMLALVNHEGAAAVRFERQDNGIVRYEWRYLSAADAALDPKPSLDPNPHELRGEGTLEPIMMGPMPHIDAGPIDLSWSPSTELQGWVNFNPARLEVLPFKRSLFASEKGPFDSYTEALDLSSLLVSDDVPGDRTVEQLPHPIRQVASRLVYDAMVLVVSHPQGVAAFEFYDSFSEGNTQTQSREGVRYRCYYRHDNGIDDEIGFSEVYEVYKDGQYNQGQLELQAGPIRIEWSNGDSEVGWIYYDPRDVHCSLVSREYFEQFLPAGSSETDRRFDLGRFRHGPRPLTPPVDAEPVAVIDDTDPGETRQQAVAEAIANGVSFLIDQQNQAGEWTTANSGNHAVGINSLALLSLLEAGRPIEDPAVEKALVWLRGQDDSDQTYDVALMLMALAAVGDEDDQSRIQRLADSLQEIQGEAGAWGYSQGGGNWWDNSNSQYAAYGLYAAHNAGVEVGLEVVRAAIDHYVDAQIGDVAAEDGAGWNYRGETGGSVSGNMTASAIASLIMLCEILDAQPEVSEEDAARIAAAVTAIEAGQRWLDRHFSARTNPGEPNWLLCYLMNLRHAAELSELTMFGDHDWYREGADVLVQGQNRNDGSWTSASENDPVVATSMALLFLSAGQDDAGQAAITPSDTKTLELLRAELRRNQRALEVLQENGLGPEDAEVIAIQEHILGWELEILKYLNTMDPMPSVEGLNTFLQQHADPAVPQGQPTTPPHVTPTVPSELPASPQAPRTIVLIELKAAADGSLGELRFFNEPLGTGAATIESLVTRIEQLKSERATARELYHLVAQVTADESLQYGAVVGVIDACRTAGIEDIELSTGPTDLAIEASVGYLRDASGRKLSEDPILSLPRATGSVDEAVSLFQNLTDRLAGEVHERGGPLSPKDLVFQLNVDSEIPSDIVQKIIQHAANAGFEKFHLRSLESEAEPTDRTTSAPTETQTATANIEGEVVALDEPNQRVVISIGSEDGVATSQEYCICRSSEDMSSLDIVALCEVITVAADSSVTRITENDASLGFPQIGDKVVIMAPRAPERPATSSSRTGDPVDEALRQKIVASLGLELEAVPATDDRLDGTDFHGGLEVVDVRADGPAAEEGIKTGDILVGLHQWETVSLDNVAFVMSRAVDIAFTRVQFFIVRDGETMHGHIVPESIGRHGDSSGFHADDLSDQLVAASTPMVQLHYVIPDDCSLMHSESLSQSERVVATCGSRVETYVHPAIPISRNVRVLVSTLTPSTPEAIAFLEHNALPIQVTRDDLDAVLAGNAVAKVIYFPAVGDRADACEAISSTRLDPGVDPVVEAESRGDVLAVVHLSFPQE